MADDPLNTAAGQRAPWLALAEACRAMGLGGEQVQHIAQVVAGLSRAGPGATVDGWNTVGAGTVSPTSAPQTGASVRYTLREVIGRGGMGMVYRAWDRDLERDVALKIALDDRGPRSDGLLDEARVTASLGHGAILQVHDIGTLEDGRPFYAMQLLPGRDLSHAIRAAHAVRGEARPQALFDLVGTLRRAAEGVAHAHRRAVVHRDLKPANIRVGADGDVTVIDWGIAARLNRATSGAQRCTPAYASPEQARGEAPTRADDVYSLGMSLVELLGDTGGAHGPPERHPHVLATLEHTHSPELTGLLPLARSATAVDPAQRPPDAEAFVAELARWQSRAEARAEARVLLGEAEEQRALGLRRWAELAPHDPVDRKPPPWQLEDRASAVQREAEVLLEQVMHGLHVALQRAPDLSEAHVLLAELYRERHAQALAAGHSGQAEAHALALAHHDRDGRHRAWLAGEGTIHLHTRPAGAEAILRPFVERDRRLVPGEPIALGTTPLQGLDMPSGSHLLELHRAGHPPLRLPILVERDGVWTLQAPGEAAPRVLDLQLGDLDPNTDCLVPEGWFLAGSTDRQGDELPRRSLWVERFLIRRDPVTVREYFDFLDDLVDEGREEEALEHAPELRRGDERLPCYQRDGRGRILLP